MKKIKRNCSVEEAIQEAKTDFLGPLFNLVLGSRELP